MHEIAVIHVASRQTYGVPRIDAELRWPGRCVNRKRTARPMREHGIQVGRCRRTNGRGSGKIFVGGDHLEDGIGQRTWRAACDCALLNWSVCYHSCLMCWWSRSRSLTLWWRSGPARDPVFQWDVRDADSSARGATAAMPGAYLTSRSPAGLYSSTCPYAVCTARTRGARR
ncbi:transposase [Streptomyces virginiae]|uniref:transposase n=1 Tax=Streptomyces virginiae TaxID=1961 RepID=UPI003D807E0D